MATLILTSVKLLISTQKLTASHLGLRTSLTLKKKYARTNVLKYSSVHRITDQWNQLPSIDICVSDNVNIFKSRVKNFFSDF